MKYPTLFLLVSLAVACTGPRISISPAERVQLQNELRDIWASDQQYRLTATELRQKNKGVRTDEEAALWQKQTRADSLNMIRVEAIIARYGYPGASLVGDELKAVCAFVIIHNPAKQEKYLKLLWAEARKGNVDKREVAILDDRINMLNGKKQRYGTAMKYEPGPADPQTGEVRTTLRVWDIANTRRLDKKRERVGWNSLKVQCALMGIDWTQVKGYRPGKNRYDAAWHGGK